MQYSEMELATIPDSMVSRQIQGRFKLIQAACDEIAAGWDESQRKERRVEAKRLQFELYLILFKTS